MERIGAKNHLRPWSLHSIPGTYPWLYYIDSAFCISLLSQNRFASVVCSCCSSASSLTLLVTFWWQVYLVWGSALSALSKNSFWRHWCCSSLFCNSSRLFVPTNLSEEEDESYHRLVCKAKHNPPGLGYASFRGDWYFEVYVKRCPGFLPCRLRLWIRLLLRMEVHYIGIRKRWVWIVIWVLFFSFGIY